jgi:general secretion pathway protein G
MSNSRRRGFSLVEILIVVVVFAILAAIVIGVFSPAGDAARYSAIKQSLADLRNQIGLYRIQHENRLPGAVAGADPDTLFVEHMTQPTNELGDRGPFADPEYPFGPYFPNQIPPNPINRSRTVMSVTAFPASAPAGTVDDPTQPGWVYETKSGRVKVNWGGVTPDGQNYWDL